MYKKMLLVLCVVLMATTAQAAYWTNAAGDNDFNNGANWEGGAFPTGANADQQPVVSDHSQAFWDEVNGVNGGTGNGMIYTQLANSPLLWTNQVMNTSAASSVASLYVGSKFGVGTLNVAHDLTSTSEAYIGGSGWGSDYCVGTLNQTAGASVYNDLRIGYRYSGEYNLYGGTVYANSCGIPRKGSGWDMDWYLGTINYDSTGDGIPEFHTTLDGRYPTEFAKAQMNVYGGVATFNELFFGGDYPKGVLNVERGGKVVLLGDQTAFVDWYVHWWNTGAARIIADGGARPVVSWFDGTNTIIIPEPATMAMLALGAFGLIRRKK